MHSDAVACAMDAAHFLLVFGFAIAHFHFPHFPIGYLPFTTGTDFDVCRQLATCDVISTEHAWMGDVCNTYARAQDTCESPQIPMHSVDCSQATAVYSNHSTLGRFPSPPDARDDL